MLTNCQMMLRDTCIHTEDRLYVLLHRCEESGSCFYYTTWPPACVQQGTLPHPYRVEVTDNTLKLLINGSQDLAVTNNRYLAALQAGLWYYGFQIIITSFKVLSL